MAICHSTINCSGLHLTAPYFSGVALGEWHAWDGNCCVRRVVVIGRRMRSTRHDVSTQRDRNRRNRIGTDLNSHDLVEATRLQEIYVGEICRQAGLRVWQQGDALYCDELKLKPAEWATFVQAGMNDIGRRCDAYLAWLDNKRRWREPILKQFNITAAATAAILGLTKVGPTPIAIVGTAFGLAQDTFTNISTRLITEANHSVV
jgi:hypothetical protein